MSIKLLAMDFDSTLVIEESLNELASYLKLDSQISSITEQAMAGKIDFTTSMNLRVKSFKDAPSEALTAVGNRLTASPGATELINFCKLSKIRLSIISGGFIQILDAFSLCKVFDYVFANSLEIHDGKLTGSISDFSIDAQGKANALAKLANELELDRNEIMAIGDGANDLEMISFAGIGVSFRGKPILDNVAKYRIENSLDEVIPLLQAS
jgi:phosphoserine phosphatase